MKKKILSIILAGCMMVALAACGKDSGNNSDTNEAGGMAEASQEEEAPALDTENIYDLYVTWPSISGAPEDLQMVEDAVNDMIGEKLGINVIFNSIPLQDLTSQQQLLVSSGGNIDIIICLWTGLDPWIGTESLLELDEYMETYAPDLIERLGEVAYTCSKNGHIYAFPKENAGYSYGFAANSDILEKYGFDTQDRTVTIEELEEIFQTIKDGEGNSFYPVAGGGRLESLDIVVDNLGSSDYMGGILIDKDAETVVNIFETEEFRDYAYRMYDWAQKGFISRDAATTEDTMVTLVPTGNYLGAFTFMAADMEILFNVPVTNLVIHDGITRVSDLTDILYGVASTCEQPEKAVAFLNELLTNKDLDNLLEYGIEGKHYVVVDENEKGNKLVELPEGIDMTSSGYYVTIGVWNPIQDMLWNTSGFESIEFMEKRSEYEISPAFGFMFDSTEYTNQVTALSAVYNEYIKIIQCGAVNPDTELPNFIDALKAAGIDEVIAGKQAQYDEWRNSR